MAEVEDMELSQLNGVGFPDMRRNVISAVRALADAEYQRRVWIERIYPREGYYDDFTLNLNILYDDTLVLDDPASTLGTVLRSEGEVSAMEALASAVDALLQREGDGRMDADYMASPLWDAVLRSALVAYEVMTREPLK
ncbi:hypothetical protein NGF19_20160 [Streptomyces sp. RY43-2]|uniref:Uncharacterized protein n=1 Tax=Streptomyces macrolidinus TaxID=2952607 RepID=A0ABT0ZHR0_9ACTN|nr:hypothetical protein [Streptomyces macrolidinus]MCN9243085.1 hypothetical protein [Streptomyces macrolidinus]